MHQSITFFPTLPKMYWPFLFLLFSSESAFSTGGRVLDPFRSSLYSSTIQSLICTQNWLRTPLKPNDLRVELDNVEKIEEGNDNLIISLYYLFLC